MRKILLISFLGMLCLGLGLALSCATGDDDADDDAGDDDAGDDDDDTNDATDDDADDDTDDDADDDTSGNLTWQDPPSSDYMTWEEAISYCENLSFSGHDDWRLPTISELRSLIRGCDGTVTGGSCGVTDSCLDSSCQDESCYACEYGAGPNNGCYGPPELAGECDWYWSSSPVADFAGRAWFVNFSDGAVPSYDIVPNGVARCVRP